jgi:hypothetical protein
LSECNWRSHHLLHYPIIIQQKIAKNEENFNCRWRAKYCNGSGIYFKKEQFWSFIARDKRLYILKVQPGCDYSGCYDAYGWWFATLEQIKKDERLRHCKVISFRQKTKEKTYWKGLTLGMWSKPFHKKLVEQVQDLIQ